MFCAGDDDQAIYEWSGADVDHFISLPGGSEVLEQSYRVPAEIHRLATNIANRIKRRFPKKYLPKNEPGKIQRIYGTGEIDFSSGEWLILSQANYQLQPVAQDLRQRGVYFEERGHPSVRPKVSVALDAWRKLRRGEAIDLASAKAMYSQEMGWEEALDRLPDVDRVYLNVLLKSGENLLEMPRVRLSTIHGAKGGEAENVVLFTDLTAAAETSMTIEPDVMHRVFYVAVTRSKQNLYLVEPDDYGRSYVL